MATGITTIKDKKYLFGATSGKLYYGLTPSPDGNTYYADNNGIIQTGWQTIGKNKYYFNEQGVMQIGFISINNDKYYFYESGKMATGITEINGKKYLLGATSGKLYYGWTDAPDGNRYYTNEEGIIQTGIIEVNGKKYLLGATSGKLYYGWTPAPDGNIYYTNEEGIIQTGSLYIDGSWYNFDDSGKLQTGWQTLNNKKYYYYADGTKAMGARKIAGTRYLFSDSGELLLSNFKLWIDISHHNGEIKWDQLWASGDIDGVIIRVGYAAHGVDRRYEKNIEAVKRLGIPYSLYYYSYAENAAEALGEAQNMLYLYRKMGANPSIPTYYDIEEYTNLSQNTYDSIIRTYKEYLNNNGIAVNVYASARFAESHFQNETNWVAHYTGKVAGYTSTGAKLYSVYPSSVTNYKGQWKIWQYTNNGHVEGIDSRVDLDIVYY